MAHPRRCSTTRFWGGSGTTTTMVFGTLNCASTRAFRRTSRRPASYRLITREASEVATSSRGSAFRVGPRLASGPQALFAGDRAAGTRRPHDALIQLTEHL